MKYLLNHTQMKAVDDFSIRIAGIPSLVLMECAAAATVRRLLDRLTPGARILAVSGTGNNGADAVAAARILHNKGYETAVVIVGHKEKYSEELKKQQEIIRNLNIPEYNINDIHFDVFDWILDGLFGIGLGREIQGEYADVVKKMNESGVKVCAVDIPSGVSADDGQVLGCAVKASMTVTFGYMKLGLVLHPGISYAGDVYVEDIGFVRGADAYAGAYVRAFEQKDVKKYLPERFDWSNKGSYGKLLVIAGSKNMGGAAYFCAAAGYRTGVGLVKVLTTEDHRTMMQQMIPEAILETYLPEKIRADACPGQPFETWFDSLIRWADAIVIGPGMGKDAHVSCMLQRLMQQREKPVLIDADGLNVLSENMDILRNHLCPVIVTPHLGEMARLTGKSVRHIQESLMETCEAFAEDYRVVCVLKDARTIISDGTGHTFVNLSGNNGMSTGGSGDVLAGIIGGLMCQNRQQFVEMAALGAYIHGLSGDEAKKICGVYGLLASDIIKYMSYILK